MPAKLRIGMIGSEGVPARYGGYETLAHQLSHHLKNDFSFVVYANRRRYSSAERKARPSDQIRRIHLPASSFSAWCFIYYVLAWIHAIRYTDLIWLVGRNVGFGAWLVHKLFRKKLIVFIDDIHWKRKAYSWPLKWLLKWSEHWLVQAADVLLLSSSRLQPYFEEKYQKKGLVLTYGGNHVGFEAMTHQWQIKYPFLIYRYALKMCKIEPYNQVETTLRAFAKYPRYHLVIIGNWSASKYGRRLRKRYRDYTNLHMLDPEYDPKALNVIRSHARFYVHGNAYCGTNLALVEAMNMALPVLAYDQLENRNLTEGKALYFEDEMSLLKLLESLHSESLHILGQSMQAIGQRRFNWPNIAEVYRSLFLALFDPSIDSELVNQDHETHQPAEQRQLYKNIA